MEDMNILMLAPFYNVYIKEFTEALANYVSSITVVVHHNPLTEISKYLPKRGYVRYLHRYTKDNLVDKEGTPDNVNLEIVSLPYFIPDGKNPFLGDWVFKKVSRIIQKKSIEFDIIHAHSTWIDGYVGAKIKKMYNRPLVITLHHDLRLNYTKMIENKIIWSWSVSDSIISVNKNEIKKLPPILGKRAIHIPNGFNPHYVYPIEKQKARRLLKLPQTKKILFSFGYLIKRKGFMHLVKAMKYITREIDDVKCFIGGDGPERDKLNRQISKLGLRNHVQLIGYAPKNIKTLWLNATDLFVFPSLDEAFGIPVLEALAVGTPVVATINGGSEELITSEKHGILAKPADPKDLAEKIIVALERDWNKEEIRKYAEQFTWANIAKRTLDVYSGYKGLDI